MSVVSAQISASGGDAPSFGTPHVEYVAQKSLYYFVVRDYTPPLEVKPMKTEPPWETPEATAQAQFGAMMRQDYKGWLKTWDHDSQVVITKRNQEMKRGDEFWTAKWRQGLQGYERFQLTRRVDSGEFVIIEFRASGGTGGGDLSLDIPMTKTEKGWLASQELGSDPVLLNWRQPGAVTEIVARQPPIAFGGGGR